MSRLLLRLETQLGAATDPVERGELQVQRACYLARMGRFDEAEAEILAVRKLYGDGTQPRISCWLMLAEGLCEHFRNVSPRARDRIARAQLISVAIKDPTLAAITSAWKALVDFENSEFTAMADALRTALRFAADDDHHAHARVALVISNCLLLCGAREEAQTWFMKCRAHALEVGDQATIEAVLYSRAAFGMACLRAERCIAPQDVELIALVKREIASACNFHAMIGNEALKSVARLCEARAFLLNREFQLALEKLQAVPGSGPFASYNYSDQLIALESVYCLHNLGRSDEAMRIFVPIRETSYEGLDIDDQLVAVWTLHELAQADGRYGDPLDLAARLAILQAAYRASRELIRRSIDAALGP